IEADLLVEVVDVVHENAIEQSETVSDVLQSLDASDKPRVTALNKIDLFEDQADIDGSLYPNEVPISALQRIGLDDLRAKIAAVLANTMEAVQVVIPYRKSDLVELFHRRGHVLKEEHGADGTFLTGRLPRSLAGYYREFLVDSR